MDNTIVSGTNVLVGTPAYGGMVHIDYLNSILNFHHKKIPFGTMSIGNESLIPRGRNTIISNFYSNEGLQQFTHLLFLDGDVRLAGRDLIKLLSHKKDVIGAGVALKGFDYQGKPVYNVYNIIGSDGDLLKVGRVGTAVFMLSRKAVNSLVEFAIENGDVYNSNDKTRGTKLTSQMYDIFKTGTFKGEYLSEDYYVCKKLIELNYNIWVDETIRTVHNGMYVFT